MEEGGSGEGWRIVWWWKRVGVQVKGTEGREGKGLSWKKGRGLRGKRFVEGRWKS